MGEMRDDFLWVYTDEPHASRRREILKKYPQIRELFGYEPKTKYIVLGLVSAQLITAYLIRNSAWWWIFLIAYVWGGTISHSLNLAIHEISHNLAFPWVFLLYFALNFLQGWQNRLLGYFANIPIPVHTSITFMKYHMDHHKFQGSDVIDTDIPTDLEGRLVRNAPAKLLWVWMQPLFYALRPLVVNPKTPDKWTILGWAIAIASNICIYTFMSPVSLAYLGLGFHMVAGHFIAEHYVFTKDEQETFSYYGPLNWICFNVGYHNEHHDFPRIPGTRLPQVREIAPEYYENLASYQSWGGVIWEYITNPSIGPFSRVKRNKWEKGGVKKVKIDADEYFDEKEKLKDD